MSINTKAISEKIAVSLNNNGINKPITIYRQGVNEFNEPLGEIEVCTVSGYLRECKNKQTNLTINLSDGGKLVNRYKEKLLVSSNINSRKIKENDIFYYENKKYKIIDLGNNMDIVFDMALERI